MKKYFDDIKTVWANKDIAIICGESVFNEIEYNIFDAANTVEYQKAPTVNAFEEYDKIFQNAKKIDINKIIIIILGPTAKVLAYDLAKEGYRALDLGHIAKSYDWYMKNKTTSKINDLVAFFSPG